MTQEDKDIVISEIERLEVEIPYHDNAWSVLNKLKVIINTLPAEQPSDKLAEEIKLYQLRNPVINHNERSLNELIKRVATYFANWQKEQMLKSAIDGCYISRNKYTKKNVLHGFDITCDAIQKFKDGDKVKILVIKEDED